MTYEDINIVYEDNHLLVVVKPQNIPVCGDESGDENLLDMLKEYRKVNENKPGEAYLGLVHRLDRPTGGVMVFAKTSKAAAALSAEITSGTMEKSYLAVSVGVPADKRGELRNMLMKDADKNIVYCVPYTTEGAKLAVLDYEVAAVRAPMALLKIDLLTGRSHQIRVQFSHINCPIFGDQKYGQGKTPARHTLALWAYQLRLIHPTTKEAMVFRVLPPEDVDPWRFFDNYLQTLYR